jgi:hypothetical protein
VERARKTTSATGSTAWTELDGTVVARKIWDGRANLAEIELDGPLARIHVAPPLPSSIPPMDHAFCQQQHGHFERADGSGNSRMVARKHEVNVGHFAVEEKSFHGEQSFSVDGKSWETNWIEDFARAEPRGDQSRPAIGDPRNNGVVKRELRRLLRG